MESGRKHDSRLTLLRGKRPLNSFCSPHLVACVRVTVKFEIKGSLPSGTLPLPPRSREISRCLQHDVMCSRLEAGFEDGWAQRRSFSVCRVPGVNHLKLSTTYGGV